VHALAAALVVTVLMSVLLLCLLALLVLLANSQTLLVATKSLIAKNVQQDIKINSLDVQHACRVKLVSTKGMQEKLCAKPAMKVNFDPAISYRQKQ
jgi:apolipoprotein N-acyltransferase